MMVNREYYFKELYPLQDKVLKIVNDNARFGLWSDRIIHVLSSYTNWNLNILQREYGFTRISLLEWDMLLKIEMINDVPSHIGSTRRHETLGMLDSPENILANKVTAAIGRKRANYPIHQKT